MKHLYLYTHDLLLELIHFIRSRYAQKFIVRCKDVRWI